MPSDPAPPDPKPHKTRLQDALQAAEWAAAQGAMAGPILHLRQRGNAARVDARVSLWALIGAVVAGLIFYLGVPFWQQLVDGKRQTLNDSISATEQVLLTLDGEREARRTDLVAALRQVGDRQALPGSEIVWFNGALALDPDTALIYGSDGTVIRWTRAGGLDTEPVLPGSEDVEFNGALALDRKSVV